MVLGKTDFIGNDDTTGYQLFDMAGNVLLNQILQSAGDVRQLHSSFSSPRLSSRVRLMLPGPRLRRF